MTTKTHITKVDNTQIERGVQMRSENPSAPVDKQIWWNGSAENLSVFEGGKEKVINTRVLTADPQYPKEHETWINTTTQQFKFVQAGVTHSINFGATVGSSDSDGSAGYLQTLTDAELKKISDISTAYPDYMIDSFNEVKDVAVYTDVEVTGSRLKVATGKTTGSYSREERTSAMINHTEGILVGSFPGLAPFEVTANVPADGKHTLKFHGNVTTHLAHGKHVLGFEKITQGKIEKNIYFLGADNKPAKLEIVSPTYDSTTNVTTLQIVNQGIDLTAGYAQVQIHDSIRFYPFDLAVQAGANGLAGALTNLTVEEAHSLEARRILGQEIIHDMEKSLKGAVHELVVQHSPNKLNWLIAAKVMRPSLSDEIILWYSTDGLQTVHPVEGFSSPAVLPGGNEAVHTGVDYSDGVVNSCFNKQTMSVSDDGRWVFGHRRYNPANYHDNQFWFGKMSSTSFRFALFPAWGGYTGAVHHTTSIHLYDHNLAMDWENNCAAVFIAGSHPTTIEPYIVYYTFDWDQLVGYMECYSHLGSNHNQWHYPSIMFWKTFEGERQLFFTNNHTNGHAYAWKVRLQSILDQKRSRANIGASAAFSGQADNGGRYETHAFTHQLAATNRFLGYTWNDDESELLITKADDSSQWLVTVNFGRTRPGKGSETTLAFSATPDAGTYTITVKNGRTLAEATTGSLAYNATASAIKSALELLAPVGAGNATVTGDHTTGFNIKIAVLDDMILSTGSHTLTSATVAVTLTYTKVVVGESARWLYWNNGDTSYVYKDLGSMIQLSYSSGPLWTYDGTNRNDTQFGRSHFTQRMLCVGNTVYITGDWVATDYDYDAAKSTFIKIPDYKTCRGMSFQDSPGVLAGIGAFLDPASSSIGSNKFAQIFTVPASSTTPNATPYAYADGLVPIRTISLYMHTSYSSQKTLNPNHKISVKVVGILNGKPDESVVHGVGTFKIPELGVVPHDDWKWHEFCFDDLRLAPNTKVCLIVECNFTIGDQANINPTGQGTAWKGYAFLGGNALTNTDYFRVNGAGAWENLNYKMWMRIADIYICKTADAQANPLYRYSHHLNNSWSWEDSESSIGFVGAKTDRILNIVYRNAGLTQVASGAYTGEGEAARSFIGKIKDTNGIFKFPTFEVPKLLGDAGLADPHLVFGVNFGDDSSHLIDNRTGKFYGNYGRHFSYRAYGGVPLWSADGNALALSSLTGVDAGIVVDPDFACGRGYKINGHSLYYLYHHALFPGPLDFCVEFEYKPDPRDYDGGNQNMIIDVEGCIRCEMHQGKYQFLVWGNPGEAWTFESVENVKPGHQIIRYGRDWNGAFIKVSYDKGATWNDLTIGGTGSLKNVIAGGRVLGIHSTGWQHIMIGRYYHDRNYDCYGTIGYLKFIFGASAPAYPGLIRMDAETDFRRILNFGDKVLAMRLIQNTWSSSTNNIAAVSLLHADEKTSFVQTRDQLLKFKSTIATGRSLALKATLGKVSDKDATSIQGVLFNFEKK